MKQQVFSMKSTTRTLIAFLLLAGGIVLLTLTAGVISAKTITVDDDGGADYSSIQKAVDAAEAGDTIRVFDGTYFENIVVNKTVSLIGNGSANTTIDGGGYGPIIKIGVGQVNVTGFNITNSASGGNNAITINTGTNTISNNIFFNNYYGIYLSALHQFSDNNVIKNNIFSNNARASIYIFSSNYSLVQNNVCGDPTGIKLDSSSNNILNNNTFEDNKHFGIKMYGSSSGACENNLITGNSISSKQSGVYFYDATNTTIRNNLIMDCESGISAVYNCYLSVIHDNDIMNNSLGIMIQISNENEIVNNTIQNNTIGISIQKGWTEDPSMNNTIHYNNIYGNTDFGVNATDNAGYTTDATNNWWGDDSGPYHPADNPGGKGDNVTDYVLFDPWISSPSDYFPPEAIIGSLIPDHAVEGNEIHFHGQGKAYDSITRYVWRSSLDGSLYNGTSSSFSLLNLSNGTHTIFLRVQDDFSIWSEEVSITLAINGRPVAEITDISPNPVKENQTITFTAQGTDDGSIARYVWRSDLDGPLHNDPNTVFTLSNLSAGNHTIYLKVLDDLGVWSGEVNTTLTITPNTIPAISITSPGEGDAVKGKVTILGTASDEDGTVEKVEISIDGGEWLPATGTESWSFEVDTEELENAEYTIKVRCFDGENYSDEKSITFEVENKEDGGGGEGFLPGFGILISLGAFITCAVLRSWKKQPKQ